MKSAGENEFFVRPNTQAWTVIAQALANDGVVNVDEINTELPEAFEADREANNGHFPRKDIALWSALTHTRASNQFPQATLDHISNSPAFADISGAFDRECTSRPLSRQEMIAFLSIVGGMAVGATGGMTATFLLRSQTFLGIGRAGWGIIGGLGAGIVLFGIILMIATTWSSANAEPEYIVSPSAPDYCRETFSQNFLDCEPSTDVRMDCGSEILTIPNSLSGSQE